MKALSLNHVYPIPVIHQIHLFNFHPRAPPASGRGGWYQLLPRLFIIFNLWDLFGASLFPSFLRNPFSIPPVVQDKWNIFTGWSAEFEMEHSCSLASAGRRVCCSSQSDDHLFQAEWSSTTQSYYNTEEGLMNLCQAFCPWYQLVLHIS